MVEYEKYRTLSTFICLGPLIPPCLPPLPALHPPQPKSYCGHISKKSQILDHDCLISLALVFKLGIHILQNIESIRSTTNLLRPILWRFSHPSSNLQLYHNQLKQCLNRNIIRSQLQLKDDFFSAKGEINNSGTFISTPPEAVKGFFIFK